MEVPTSHSIHTQTHMHTSNKTGSKNKSITLFVCAQLLSHVWLFVTPRTLAHQAPLSMGILQARILEWVAMPSSMGSSQPRDKTQVSHIAGRFLTSEPSGKPKNTEMGSLSLHWGTSRASNWTGVSCTAGRFFPSWVTREDHDSP